MPQIRVSFNQGQLNRLRRKLDPARYKRVVGSGLLAAATYFEGKIKEYPPKSGRPGDTYARGIDASSENLGRRWTVRPRRWNEVVVGNNASYAVWVQSDEMQTWFHEETGWPTEVTTFEEYGNDMKEEMARHIQRWLDD
jgi:hypothetical protein